MADLPHEDERAQLLSLKELALTIADGHCANPESFRAAVAALEARLVAYKSQFDSPQLVQVNHLITVCQGLGSRIDTLAGGKERQQAFQPLLVALSRVASTTAPVVAEGDRHQPAAEPFPLDIVLVNLRSAFNVGSIVRTAECYGAGTIHVAGYTAGLDHPKVASVAMGCEQSMPWSASPEPAQLLSRLAAKGVALVALETAPVASAITEFDFPFPAALIVGNERFGIEPELLSQCQHIVRLPMYGKKNSLNVAGACAIAIHHARSQWQNQRTK